MRDSVKAFEEVLLRSKIMLRIKVAETPQHLERFKREYSRYAQEPVEVEEIGGVYYAFGSELAVLRLYHKMRGHGRAGYSENMKRWYYSPNG